MSKEIYTRRNSQDYAWESRLASIVSLYYGLLMTVYLLYCHNGYNFYDLYKRRIFIAITSVYLILMIIVYIVSRVDVCTTPFAIPLKKRFDKIDWLMGATIASWSIGLISSEDKYVAFWGDEFREIGFILMVLMLAAAWITSRFVEWNDILTVLFWIVCMCENVYQIMHYYSIDLLNWQYYGTFTNLLATLGAVNQNGIFCALELAILLCVLINTENKKSETMYYIMIFVAFTSGIAIRSSVFYLGAFVAVVVILGYSLLNEKNLWRLIKTLVVFVVAIAVQAILYPRLVEGKLIMEGVTLKLFEGKMICLMLLTLIILVAAVYFVENKNMLKKFFLFKLYKIIVLICSAITLFMFTIANLSKNLTESSLLANFRMNYEFGTGRGFIWDKSLEIYKSGSIWQKLFGIGFNNYSIKFAEMFTGPDIEKYTGALTVADAHNAYLDMLIATGIVGVILYFTLLIFLLIAFFKLLKTNSNAIIGIVVLGVYFVVSLINSNLIITTPMVWMVIALNWKAVKEKQYEELGGL